MARKHYRAAQKTVECTAHKNKETHRQIKHKMIAIGGFVLLLAFLKGLLIGYLAGKNK